MKNSTKLKRALLKEFGHPQGPIERDFEEPRENDVTFGNERRVPRREEQEYAMCPECYVPAMYEGECHECGYMEEEKHEVFMAQKNLEAIIKSATELMHKLGTHEQEVPAWIEDHISKAQSFIEQANDGFYFEDEEDMEYNTEEEPEHNYDITLSNMMEVIKAKVKPSKGLTKKQKSNIEKKAHKGKNIDHGGFDKLAKKAAKEYGSKEAGKRVAAAAMWKGIHRK